MVSAVKCVQFRPGDFKEKGSTETGQKGIEKQPPTSGADHSIVKVHVNKREKQICPLYEYYEKKRKF